MLWRNVFLFLKEAGMLFQSRLFSFFSFCGQADVVGIPKVVFKRLQSLCFFLFSNSTFSQVFFIKIESFGFWIVPAIFQCLITVEARLNVLICFCSAHLSAVFNSVLKLRADRKGICPALSAISNIAQHPKHFFTFSLFPSFKF